MKRWDTKCPPLSCTHHGRNCATTKSVQQVAHGLSRRLGLQCLVITVGITASVLRTQAHCCQHSAMHCSPQPAPVTTYTQAHEHWPNHDTEHYKMTSQPGLKGRPDEERGDLLVCRLLALSVTCASLSDVCEVCVMRGRTARLRSVICDCSECLRFSAFCVV